MSRAFLSHSSQDKAYVAEVATLLGRPRSVIDAKAFRPGHDFREEIKCALDDSDVFVLFVSQASLASTWCEYELDEADVRRVKGSLRRGLAIFIDGPVEPHVLPDWLARLKAVSHTAPRRVGQAYRVALAVPQSRP